MRKFTAIAFILVFGVLVLTGFSTDTHVLKNAPSRISIANDYSNFTQYMQ